MQTHRMHVVIPADGHLMLEVPEAMRSQPADLIFIVPAGGEVVECEDRASAEALARWDATVAALEVDPKPFQDLSQSEKKERLKMLRGVGRGLFSSSEEFARRKREEVELEESKFA